MNGVYMGILNTVLLISFIFGCKTIEPVSTQDADPDTVTIEFVQRTDMKPLLEERPVPVWQVHDNDSYPDSSGTFVNRGDRIQIIAPVDTDLELELPNKYESLFDEKSKSESERRQRRFVSAGDTLTLVVKETARPGTYEYAVLIIRDCTMAIGDSIPTIKIK